MLKMLSNVKGCPSDTVASLMFGSEQCQHVSQMSSHWVHLVRIPVFTFDLKSTGHFKAKSLNFNFFYLWGKTCFQTIISGSIMCYWFMSMSNNHSV